MALPKRRHSKTRRNKRRTHYKIAISQTVPCPQCGESKLPHRICAKCGTYRGREILEVE